MLSESERLNKCKSCNGCTEWLGVCKAECCSLFSFKINGSKKREFKKGQVLWFNVKLNKDKVNYYKLHGCQYWMGRLKVKLDCDFTVDGDWLFIHKRCTLLNDDNLCDGHFDGRKPELCKGLNLETANDKGYILTPNCLYKYRQLVQLQSRE